MPPRFFITHSWNDIEFAERFANDLRARGLDGFFDKYSLSPGDIVSAEIQRGLEKCDFYTPILSYAALKSPWCEEEINAAITLGKLPGRNGRPRIIPILVEDCRDQMERFNFLLARLYVIFEKRYDEAFQEFWRGVMAAPTQDSPIIPKPPLQPTARETAPSSSRSFVDTKPNHAPNISSQELERWNRDALEAFLLGDWARAANGFERIIRVQPDNRDAAGKLVESKRQLRLQDLRAVVKTFLAQESWGATLGVLEEIIALDPDDTEARKKFAEFQQRIAAQNALSDLYQRGLKAFDAKDWAEAKRYFEKVGETNPDYLKTREFLAKLPPEFRPLPTRITNKAGQEMILIPAGEFLMGTSDAEAQRLIQEFGKGYAPYVRWEQPQHSVYLDAFYISRYPVTNAEYKKFKTDWTIPNGKENHPVVNVNWKNAAAYCEWAGGRLPTEAEWEKAASWDDAKRIKRIYPWGDAFDMNKCNSKEARIGDTTPVGKYSPKGDSFYGVGDMAGNVWEWCADWFDENYYEVSSRENPQGPASGQYRVLRGGSFGNAASDARCARRSRLLPVYLHTGIGFRVVAAPVRL